MRFVVPALIALTLVSSARAAEGGRAPPAEKGGEAAAVKGVVMASIGGWDRKDATAILAPSVKDADAVSFGTDAAEYWIGYDALKSAVEKQCKAMESQKTTVRDLRVKMLAGGKAAVVTYLLDAEGRSSGEAYSIKGMRVMAVLEKRQGKWLQVSSHGSVPVTGQAVKY
jgi:ketosteroid isomerase-like protein